MIPAIVLGNGITALGVLRVLRQQGIPVFVYSPGEDFVLRSKYYRPLPLHAPIRIPVSSLGELLAQVDLERAVLFPCSDSWVQAVANLPEPLRSRFPSSIPPESAVPTFLDKGLFAARLESERIAQPITRVLRTFDDLESVPKEIFPNAFMKPRDSESFFSRFRVKGIFTPDLSSAHEHFQRLSADGAEVVLQEYIVGPTTNQYLIDGFVDQHGQIRALLTRQKIRMYPPFFGNPCSQITVPQEKLGHAIGDLKRLLERTHYRGIFSAEFKFDPRDNLLKLLEINARPYWYIAFTCHSGMDLCRLAYDDALGNAVSTMNCFEVGRTALYPYYDFFAMLELRGHSLAGWMRWLLQILRAEQPIFAWSDPLPALSGVTEILVGRLKKIVRYNA